MEKLKKIKLKKYKDKRGCFFEFINKKILNKKKLIQINISQSKKNVLRGLHYQIKKPQTKFLTVLQGHIFDVVIDLRKSSPKFGNIIITELKEKDNLLLIIPKGFAHGFLTIGKKNTIIYGVDEKYNPNYEKTIIWNDKNLSIKWPFKKRLIISSKDKKGENFLKNKKYF